MLWSTRRRSLDLSRHGVIMGILNVTPDSFSDGGQHSTVELALAHARRMIGEGAGIIDVGGESTRPGAESVCASEQQARVVPVIAALQAADPEILISIDTSSAEVAAAALAAGADIINDITALEGDPAMPALAAETGAGVCLMHMQGQPRTMQAAPAYGDVVREVGAFLGRAVERALDVGIRRDCLALDPGIGFGKTRAHNLALLRGFPELQALAPDRPFVLGVSRKSFLGGPVSERLWPTVALTAALRLEGARVHRVHDVRPNAEALRMAEAVEASAESAPEE